MWLDIVILVGLAGGVVAAGVFLVVVVQVVLAGITGRVK